MFSFVITNLEETEVLGRKLGALLFPGAVIALIGQLGAGKTHFVRAIAEGLGVRNPAAVNSPTFVLIHEYSARLPIYHFDAYRLKTSREFAELGVEEYFHGDGVCIVEWADLVLDVLPTERLEIRIEVIAETARRFTLTPCGTIYQEMIQSLSFTETRLPNGGN